MENFLKVFWSQPATFEVRGPFTLSYKGEVDVPTVMRKRRIACPNEDLRNVVFRTDLVSRSVDRLHLVGKSNGGQARSIEQFKKSDCRHLLLLCWSFPEVCRQHCIVLPSLLGGLPIALVSEGGTFLLCAAPTAMVLAKDPKVLALGQ